jgi:serine/threonine protein kinase
VSTTNDTETARARVGTTVAQKWRLDSLVAHTTVAATYRARHRNGVETALKIIHPSRSGHAPVVDRFLQEAHLANRIDHPGVERVLDDGQTEDGCVFLVMELLEGETLEDRRLANGGKLGFDDVRFAFDGLFDALIAIHASGIHHRNLKPSNVFLTTDRRVVLTDFGRARLAEGDLGSGLTLDGMVHGTPAYMPPEQARGRRKEVDARSDIWSAGAIAFTTLAGRRVHEGKTSEERLARAQTKRAPKLLTLVPDLPPALADVIDRALAFEKKDRWESAAEMRRAYWLATGRDESTLPRAREKQKSPGATPEPEPAPKNGARDLPSALLTPTSNNPDLAPPSVRAFVEVEEAPPSMSAANEKKRGARLTTLGVVIALLVVAAAAGVIVFTFTD